MMDKKEIEKLVTRYRNKADRAFELYQESGITRYGTTARNNENLADALRIAASAADEHNTLISLRGSMANLASRAQVIMDTQSYSENADMIEAFFRDFLSLCRMYGLI